MNIEIYNDSAFTLKDINYTAEEFYDKLKIGQNCSGLTGMFSAENIECSRFDCSTCPLSDDKTSDEIRTWLKLPKLPTQVELRLDVIEKSIAEILSILKETNKIKEII